MLTKLDTDFFQNKCYGGLALQYPITQHYEAVQLLQLLQREKLSIEAATWFIVRHS